MYMNKLFLTIAASSFALIVSIAFILGSTMPTIKSSKVDLNSVQTTQVKTFKFDNKVACAWFVEAVK